MSRTLGDVVLGRLSLQLINSSFDDLGRAEGMVDMLRGFAARSPFCAHALAHGLVRLAMTQMGADRCEEALASLGEVEAACARSGRRASVLAGTLAGASFVRAATLAKLGRHVEALAVAEEHVERARELVRREGARGEPRLAWALRLLGHCLAGAGRYSDAVIAGQRAVRVGRRLMARGQDPDLGAFLVTLGGWLHRMERYTDAAEHAAEAVVLLRREAVPHVPDLAGALMNLGASLRAGQPVEALAATDEAIALYEGLLDVEPGGHETNLELVRRNRVLLLRDLGLPAEVVHGPYPVCELCRRDNGGLVAVRHRQTHVRAHGRESCVDRGLAPVMSALWEVCDTRACCEDDNGRAYVVPVVGQTALAEQVLLDLGFSVANDSGVLYFRLADLRA